MQKASIALLVVAAVSLSAAPPATALECKTVRIVVAFTAGGPSDILARIVAQHIQVKTGISAVVENKAGANGTIASLDVARSAPDGCTVLFTSINHTMNPGIWPNIAYNTREAFEPIANLAQTPNILVTKQDLPFKSVKDLVQYAKANPAKLTYGSSGIGGTGHFAGAQFAALAEIDITHVPYRGAAQVANDLLGGQIDMSFASVASVMPFIKDGKINALAVAGRQRLAALPNVPSFGEAGFANYEPMTWYGAVAPARTPSAAIKSLHAWMSDALADEQAKRQLAALELLTIMNAPEDFKKQIDQEIDQWAAVAKVANIRIQ